MWQADSDASLTEVHEMSLDLLSRSVGERHRQVESMAVVAKPAVEDHVAGRGKSAHGLLHRDRFFENEGGGRVLKFCASVRTADDDQRHGIQSSAQAAQKTGAAFEVAVDDQSVDFCFRQLGARPRRFWFHIHADVQTAKNALEHADFSPIPRNHHRRQCHTVTLVWGGFRL